MLLGIVEKERGQRRGQKNRASKKKGDCIVWATQRRGE